MPSDSDIARRLVELGVATLHEALGRRHLLAEIGLLVGEPFCGQALTVGLPAGDNLGLHLALEKAEPGSVVCAASAGRGLYGAMGEILLEAGRARGVVGFVLDDGVRDLDALMPPPAIAARGVTARGTMKRRLRQPVGAYVAVGGTLVVSGDWLICDQDGVCVVPQEASVDVISWAESRARAEEQIRDEVSGGTATRLILGLPTDQSASIS